VVTNSLGEFVLDSLRADIRIEALFQVMFKSVRTTSLMIIRISLKNQEKKRRKSSTILNQGGTWPVRGLGTGLKLRLAIGFMS
jgi:hypothetical protein